MSESKTIEAPRVEESDPTEGRRKAKINRSKPVYLRKSITRLSVIADRPLETKSDVCSALEDYGYCLPPEQREVLEKWCGIG